MIKMKDLIKKQTDMIRKLNMFETQKLRKMGEGGPGSGPHDDDDKEENPFDREPSDDEMADIEREFEGINEVSFPLRGDVSKAFKEYWRILLDLKIYHFNNAEREFPKYSREFKKGKKLADQLGDLVKKLSKVTKGR